MRALLSFLLFSSVVGDESLRDAPIIGSTPPQYLDGVWTATEASLGLSIPSRVPGDVITDLQNASVIGDPWFELNFLDNRTLWNPNATRWTFSLTNVSLSAPTGSTLLLVFEGVKMGAGIYFNGVLLGNATNQHVRYTFPVAASAVLPGADNRIDVRFDSAIQTKGRFMASTGGWDWAPLSQLDVTDAEFGTLNVFSSGIWKSVYAIMVAAAAPTSPPAITAVVPLTTYLGAYPVSALADGTHGGFSVNVTAHVWAPTAGYSGALTVSGEWGATATSPLIDFPVGESNVTLSLLAPATQVKLWWPNGLGAQPLFNVSVSWGDSAPATVRRIGFRVAALVTVNDTNATVVEESVEADGSGSGFGMFFRVNGAAIYARGGNLVPMEELEGRLDSQGYATLVHSAADANMNIIRVWGGGIYPPDVFYDTCDERGILLYHDLQFARGNFPQPLSDVAIESVLAEVSHQVRRLAPHPSLVLYDSNNEDVVQPTGPTALYASLIMTALAAEDASRIVWPNSPSAGWRSGVHRLYGTPNGAPLVAIGGGHAWSAGNEDHRFYQAGVGAYNWTTVVFDPWSQAHTFDPMLPPSVAPSGARGPGATSVFVSEFGSSSMSSFESMAGTLDPSSWGLHGGGKFSNCTRPPAGTFFAPCAGRNAMAQRNWAADNLVWSYFGPAMLNASGEAGFKGGLFQSMIAAALNMQTVIESHRSANYLGAIEWQLNEVWYVAQKRAEFVSELVSVVDAAPNPPDPPPPPLTLSHPPQAHGWVGVNRVRFRRIARVSPRRQVETDALLV